MMLVSRFADHFSSLISWVLSCFDRVIFKGHLPISWVSQFERFVDYELKIRRDEFLKRVGPEWSNRLVDHAKNYAIKHKRPYEYLPGRVDKDAWAKEQLRLHPVVQGLIGILCVREVCSTFKLAYGDGRPHFVPAKVPQRVLYYYFVDKELGFIHVRLQTWASFTCINQPGAFKIYRECRHRDGSKSKGWFTMCKSVGNMHHYQSHALACNQRYLDALSAVANPAPAYEDLKKLTERQCQKGRSYAGFNPAREEEMRLFAAVLSGDHIAQGFRNRDIRTAFYAESPRAPERQKHSAAIGRLLKRLQIRGMVSKVPRSRRWRVTDEGRRALGDTLYTYRRYKAQAA